MLISIVKNYLIFTEYPGGDILISVQGLFLKITKVFESNAEKIPNSKRS